MFILCMYSLLPTNLPIFITGKAAEDGLKLCNLDLKVGFKIMMMGSLEQDITTASTAPEIVDEVINDLDLTEEEIALENREEYLSKVYNLFRDCM